MPQRKSDARRVDRVQKVYEELRKLIVHGRLAPGSRLIEAEVAERFSVSRTPVRGALQRLEQEGYIVASPAPKLQSRPMVAPLTREDAAELFSIVGQLEGLAARLAAGLDDASRGPLAKRLRALNAEFRETARAARPAHRKLYDLDEAFHRTYVEAAAGPRLLALHRIIKPQAERYERLYVSFLVLEIDTSAIEHEVISGAIAAGDPGAAERAVRTNWRNAAERLGRVIERVGERGSW